MARVRRGISRIFRMKSPRSGTKSVRFHAQNRAWAPLLRLLRSNLRPRVGLHWATLGYIGLRWATLGYIGLRWASYTGRALVCWLFRQQPSGANWACPPYPSPLSCSYKMRLSFRHPHGPVLVCFAWCASCCFWFVPFGAPSRSARLPPLLLPMCALRSWFRGCGSPLSPVPSPVALRAHRGKRGAPAARPFSPSPFSPPPPALAGCAQPFFLQ